jgi:hypothetical protein
VNFPAMSTIPAFKVDPVPADQHLLKFGTL